MYIHTYIHTVNKYIHTIKTLRAATERLRTKGVPPCFRLTFRVLPGKKRIIVSISRKNHASKHREKSNGERYRNAVLNHVLYILISGPMDPSKRRGTSDFHEINFAKPKTLKSVVL